MCPNLNPAAAILQLSLIGNQAVLYFTTAKRRKGGFRWFRLSVIIFAPFKHNIK
jgi:hypothetical protein